MVATPELSTTRDMKLAVPLRDNINNELDPEQKHADQYAHDGCCRSHGSAAYAVTSMTELERRAISTSPGL